MPDTDPDAPLLALVRLRPLAAWYAARVGNDDITIEILESIRDELKGVRVELGEVRDETRANGVRLNEVRTELGSRLDRMAHEQIRLATAIVGLEGRMGDVVAELKTNGAELVKLNARFDNILGTVGAAGRDTAARVDARETRVTDVERRIG